MLLDSAMNQQAPASDITAVFGENTVLRAFKILMTSLLSVLYVKCCPREFHQPVVPNRS